MPHYCRRMKKITDFILALQMPSDGTTTDSDLFVRAHLNTCFTTKIVGLVMLPPPLSISIQSILFFPFSLSPLSPYQEERRRGEKRTGSFRTSASLANRSFSSVLLFLNDRSIPFHFRPGEPDNEAVISLGRLAFNVTRKMRSSAMP